MIVASSQHGSPITLSLATVSQVAQQLPQMCVSRLGTLHVLRAPQYGHSIPLPSWYHLLAQGSPAPSPSPSTLHPHLSSFPATLTSFHLSSPSTLHNHLPSIPNHSHPNPPSMPREEQPDPQSCSPSPMFSICHQLQSRRLGVIFPSALSRVF